MKISSARRTPTSRIATFYDWVYPLYPLVDLFFAPGRRRLIERVNQLPEGRLLEVGVGPGRHLSLYRRHEIVAIDCSAKMVVSAQHFAPHIDIRRMDGEALDFPDASFNYVTLFHVLSVTSDPNRMLAEVRRVLRPEGRAFVLNHETQRNVWRYLDRAVVPLAGWMFFRSWFRLEEISNVKLFREMRMEAKGVLGQVKAQSLLK